MYVYEWTGPTPAENLACDEALLDLCEDGAIQAVLRLWQPRTHFVVLGYGNRLAAAVHVDACRRRAIPILRRCSGGGTVLQGPGCLNYTLVARQDSDPLWASLAGTTQAVLERHCRALRPLLGPALETQGISDLALHGLKCSGNAQRRKRRAVLFHGTFLLGLDVSLVAELLPLPAQQPDYRRQRPHQEFLVNLDVPAERIAETLRSTWQATEPLAAHPEALIRHLVATRYATDAWNARY